MRAGLIQLNSSDDPARNLPDIQGYIAEAAERGARFVLTPEVTNCVSGSRTHQNDVLRHQDEDQTLVALRAQAAELKIWLLIGSLALKTDDPDGRFANRSFLIAPDGQIAAWYDKIHMFDVQVSETESYRESKGYRPGGRAIVHDAGFAKIGMSVCYDIRFPYLYRALAEAGAEVLVIPSAFSPVTGAAHWEPLLRARAIETGCYVLAPGQTGTHEVSRGAPRKTYGHSMVVAPWGEVLADGGTEPGVIIVDLDPMEVAQARGRVPSLRHTAQFTGP
ncbi:carbon-nitrogen hydrolase family protein [Roseovarius albus]|nr:carbon-nitrogen hydrolase family protein [Roseovarius albus]